MTSEDARIDGPPTRRVALVVVVVLLLVCGVGAAFAPSDVAHAATTESCGFAEDGSGLYASTLCWLDMSAYDETIASSPDGQPMTVSLPGGYTISFTAHSSGSAVQAVPLPSWAYAWLGNSTNPSWSTAPNYKGVPGAPALYQVAQGTDSTITLDDISVTDALGAVVTGYAFVGADAETTDLDERLSWTSDTPIVQLSGLGNACGGALTGVGTTTVTCVGSNYGARDGTAIVAATAPQSFSQSMLDRVRGGGREAVAFGVLIAKLTVDKTVVGRIQPSDSFDVSITSPEGTVLGAATTGTADTASTGETTVLTGPAAPDFDLGEVATRGTATDLARYISGWSCTNAVETSDTPLPTGSGSTATVAPAPGDDIDCTLTNTAIVPAISLVKHAATPVDVNGNGLTDAGDTIAYTFTVTNSGNTILDGVGVTDAKVGAVTCPQATLAAGAEETCTADSAYVVTADDVTDGSVDNSATATGTPPDDTASVTSAPSTTSTPTTTPAPALTLAKTASVATISAAGQHVTYSFVVVNTGNVPLHDVSVGEDSFSGSGALSGVSCPATSLVVGARQTCTATYTTTQADLDAGDDVTNAATAEGTPAGSDTPVPSNPSTVDIPVSQDPGLSILKTASPATPDDYRLGETITYAFAITNIGNVTLTDVAPREDSFSGTGILFGPVCPDAAASLAPGAVVVCTAGYTVTEDDVNAKHITNTATAIGTTPAGDPAPPSDPSTVTVPSVAHPALTLAKTADVATVTAAGQAVTYSFTITNTGDVTERDVHPSETAFNGTGGLPTPTCPSAAASLAPGASVVCAAVYRVTSADLQGGTLTNTATAVGTDPDGEPTGSAASTALVAEILPAPEANGLAGTGGDPSGDAAIGIGLLLLGATMVPVGLRRADRRRRESR